MKKVFFVDDEIEVREGIRNRIDWGRIGFEYCGDAPDGEIALSRIETIQPDVLITDIKMPFMDGLELSHKVSERMPWVKIVILTGHDEFDYARQALRLQIVDYCLKPVSSDDLLKVLKRLSTIIDDEMEKKRQMDEWKARLYEHLSLSKEKVLSELCAGNLTPAEAIEKAALFQLNLIADYFQIVILSMDVKTPFPEIQNAIQSIYESLPQLLDGIQNVMYYKRSMREIVFLVTGDRPDVTRKTSEQLPSLLQSVSSDLSASRRLEFGFGGIKDRLKQIPHSFVEAEDNKSYRRLAQQFDQLGSGTSQKCIDANDLQPFDRKPLMNFLKYGAMDDIHEFVINYTKPLENTELGTSVFGHYFLTDTVITAFNFAVELSGEIQEIRAFIEQMESTISSIHHQLEARQYVTMILTKVLQLREDCKNKYVTTINRAKDYIREHYHDPDLSLEDVAREMNMSPSYFSTLFSQSCNQTFIEYLTITRINKAMELLRTTDLKMYEIAERVGYKDSPYFCQVFKKTTGMTTRGFRRQADPPVSEHTQ